VKKLFMVSSFSFVMAAVDTCAGDSKICAKIHDRAHAPQGSIPAFLQPLPHPSRLNW